MYKIIRKSIFMGIYIIFRLVLPVIMVPLSFGVAIDSLKFNENFASFFKYWYKQTINFYQELRDVSKEEILGRV